MERKEFVCSTAKGSICCVIVVHGLLPSLIKYLRVVHPKSAALLTHHPSLAVDEVDETQLHRTAIVSALCSSSENGSCRQSSSLWFTVLLSILVFSLLPISFLAQLCAGQGGQTHEEAEGLVCSSANETSIWDFFYCVKKENQRQLSQHCALAIYLNLFPFWLFNTVDRWCLKHWIAHCFSSVLWIAQSFFFLPSLKAVLVTEMPASPVSMPRMYSYTLYC